MGSSSRAATAVVCFLPLVVSRFLVMTKEMSALGGIADIERT